MLRKPRNILVMVPEAASAAQLEALSRQVTATRRNPLVITDALSGSKPLRKRKQENASYVDEITLLRVDLLFAEVNQQVDRQGTESGMRIGVTSWLHHRSERAASFGDAAVGASPGYLNVRFVSIVGSDVLAGTAIFCAVIRQVLQRHNW